LNIRKIAAGSPYGDYEEEVPFRKKRLIPGTGENRADQRMPPKPTTGFIFPSGKAVTKNGQ
jgi:hypothetical protein